MAKPKLKRQTNFKIREVVGTAYQCGLNDYPDDPPLPSPPGPCTLLAAGQIVTNEEIVLDKDAKVEIGRAGSKEGCLWIRKTTSEVQVVVVENPDSLVMVPSIAEPIIKSAPPIFDGDPTTQLAYPDFARRKIVIGTDTITIRG